MRETAGTSGLEQTARSAAVLAHFDISHLLVGGLAVQEHGYHRVTLDVDLVVPDILEAVKFLTADLSGPFARVAGCEGLDSWAGSPTRRHNDKSDVIELIQARRLPRDLKVADPVRQHYLETWDALQAEG